MNHVEKYLSSLTEEQFLEERNKILNSPNITTHKTDFGDIHVFHYPIFKDAKANIEL